MATTAPVKNLEKQAALLELYAKLGEAEAENEQDYEDFDVVANRIREKVL